MPFAKLCKQTSTFVEKSDTTPLSQRIFIDIYPFDETPASPAAQKRHYRKAWWWRGFACCPIRLPQAAHLPPRLRRRRASGAVLPRLLKPAITKAGCISGFMTNATRYNGQGTAG
jgi:phosphorylcholine metabolism protein LicD